MQWKERILIDKRDGGCLLVSVIQFQDFHDFKFQRAKDQKVGEGTYAVVYRGKQDFCCMKHLQILNGPCRKGG
jgi:hypothetical protein